MSRARRMSERIPDDAYVTPAPLARAICERLWIHSAETGEQMPGAIMEPSAGSGPFVAAARATWRDAHVTANELHRGQHRALLQAGAHLVLHEDWAVLAKRLAVEQDPHDGAPLRLVIGNPPFRLAQAHVEAALEWLRPGDRLSFLLRINFLGSTERVPFWSEPGLASIAPIAPRPSFTGGGTDGTEYAVFTWVKGYRGDAVLQKPIVWIPERRRSKRQAPAVSKTTRKLLRRVAKAPRRRRRAA